MLLRPAGLTFATFQASLVRNIRERIRRGEFTERGLARLVGISQPHMHNVLKGRKILTPEIGDAILSSLGMCLLDVIDSSQLDEAMHERRFLGQSRLLPVLKGRLGPANPFPDWRQVAAWILPLPGTERYAVRPALVELSDDPELPPALARATHVILDLGEPARLRLRAESWYAIRWGGAGCVRQVRRRRDTLILLGQRPIAGPHDPEDARQPGDPPDRVDLAGIPILQVVRGVVAWAGADPRRGPIPDQPDWWTPPTSS
jgi:hypothetical protein